MPVFLCPGGVGLRSRSWVPGEQREGTEQNLMSGNELEFPGLPVKGTLASGFPFSLGLLLGPVRTSE